MHSDFLTLLPVGGKQKKKKDTKDKVPVKKESC